MKYAATRTVRQKHPASSKESVVGDSAARQTMGVASWNKRCSVSMEVLVVCTVSFVLPTGIRKAMMRMPMMNVCNRRLSFFPDWRAMMMVGMKRNNR